MAAPQRLTSRRAFRRRAASPGLGGVLFLSLLLVAGCPARVAKNAIVTANELQDAAAKAYNQAKADEAAAANSCKAKAAAAGVVIPVPLTKENVGGVMESCKALGAPLPYDPFVLADLAGPINAAYEGVRAADAVRRGSQPGDESQFIAAMVDVIGRLWRAATDLGIKLPTNTLEGTKK